MPGSDLNRPAVPHLTSACLQAAPQVQQSITATKAVQTQAEKALSELYQGREVHIIGEINNLG